MEYQRRKNIIFIRLDIQDEIISCIQEICRKEKIQCALVSGIGFSEEVTLRTYSQTENTFHFHTFHESMEITNITGNVITTKNNIFPHIHIMLADQNMLIHGGHLVSCLIGATGELCLEILEHHLKRNQSNTIVFND